jgi:hypothetical protein
LIRRKAQVSVGDFKSLSELRKGTLFQYE